MNWFSSCSWLSCIHLVAHCRDFSTRQCAHCLHGICTGFLCVFDWRNASCPPASDCQANLGAVHDTRVLFRLASWILQGFSCAYSWLPL
ncbi:MAG: hypothetical protein [Microviridae sp.]|nr:MAG: hypothetical protein [Microviridae sp.]